MLVAQLCLFLIPWTGARQAPLPMEFSRQEYWSGLPFPSPENLPGPGIEPGSPALPAASLPSEPPHQGNLDLTAAYVNCTAVQCRGKNPNVSDIGGILVSITAFQMFRAIRVLGGASSCSRRHPTEGRLMGAPLRVWPNPGSCGASCPGAVAAA